MREFILVCWFLPWIRPKIECFSGSVKRKLLKIQGFRPLPGCARRLRDGNCGFPQCLRALLECLRRLFGCNSRLFEGKCQLSGRQWRLLDCRRRLSGRQFPLLNGQRQLPDCKWRLFECRRASRNFSQNIFPRQYNFPFQENRYSIAASSSSSETVAKLVAESLIA